MVLRFVSHKSERKIKERKKEGSHKAHAAKWIGKIPGDQEGKTLRKEVRGRALLWMLKLGKRGGLDDGVGEGGGGKGRTRKRGKRGKRPCVLPHYAFCRVKEV